MKLRLQIVKSWIWAGFAVAAVTSSQAVAGGFISLQDYPPEALRRGWEGVTAFTVVIETDGSVGDCRITKSSGYDVLDRQTCVLLKTKARFKPAHDEKGNPVRAGFSNSVAWTIPR